MTAEEVSNDGQSIPMEGEDITPKKDGGVLKVTRFVYKRYCGCGARYVNESPSQCRGERRARSPGDPCTNFLHGPL